VSDLVTVGRVGRPHGLDGSFFVEQPSEDPERFAVGAVLVVGGEEARIVSSKRGAGGRPVLRLDRPVERGAELAVVRGQLPPPEDDSWYAFQLVGLEVVEESGAPLGRVAAVEPGVANDVIELEDGRLLPFVDACVREVDLAAGRIVVAPGFSDPLDA
jgi:16S rRNA processing protein RimM